MTHAPEERSFHTREVAGAEPAAPTISSFRDANHHVVSALRAELDRQGIAGDVDCMSLARVARAAFWSGGTTNISRVVSLADGARTVKEIADSLSLSPATVRNSLQYARAQGINARIKRTSLARDPTRDALIAAMVANGETHSSVGATFGISGERVRQIAKRTGLTPRRQAAAAKRMEEEMERADRARKERERQNKLRDMVENGASIRSASRSLGYSTSQSGRLSKRLELGALTRHGRWRRRNQETDQ